MLDDRCQQRKHVDVGARPGADLAFIFWIGQRLIGLRRVGHFVLVVEDDTGALREAEPMAIGMAQIVGDAFFERAGGNGLEESLLISGPQAARIDGKEDVGRAVRALASDPLNEDIRGILDAVDRDPSGLLEIRVKPLISVIVAR